MVSTIQMKVMVRFGMVQLTNGFKLKLFQFIHFFNSFDQLKTIENCLKTINNCQKLLRILLKTVRLDNKRFYLVKTAGKKQSNWNGFI